MFPLPEHFAVEISFKEHFKAAGAKWYPGCEQTGARTDALRGGRLYGRAAVYLLGSVRLSKGT